MSVADFDITLQNHIFNKIRDTKRVDRKTYVESLDTKKLRTKYESAESGASSVFTDSGLNKLKSQLSNDVSTLNFASDAITLLNSLNYTDFAKFAINTFNSKEGSISNTGGVIRLSKVPQGKLRDLFLEYVETVIATSSIQNSEKVFDYITINTQSGHLAGVFSLKLKEVLNLDITSTGTSYRDFTVTNNINEVTKNSLEMVIKAVLDADYVTSNIYDREEIFANATKSVLGNNPHLEIEIQFSKDNKASGALLQQAGNNLNKLLDKVSGNAANQLGQSMDSSGTIQAFTGIIKSLKPLAEMLIKRSKELQNIDSRNEKVYKDIFFNAKNLEKLANQLINTKGSPSLKESIGQNIVSLLATGSLPKQIVTKLVKKEITKEKDPETLLLKTVLKKVAVTLKQVKATADKKKKPTIRTLKGAFYSLANLQSLINSQLQNVISANMGDGSSKQVLNYRTGRLAASAKVEKLSQSREGMITAFYSYMRNPYGTFSDGGKQQNPKTRDPKLLISNSIREIAATKVANRLRAVAL